MTAYKCSKCGGSCLYKRLTVNEYNKKFLLTIIECKQCKFWIQELDLHVEKMQSVKNLDYNYGDSNMYFLPEDVSRKFREGIDVNNYKNVFSGKNAIIESLIGEDQGCFPNYSNYC